MGNASPSPDWEAVGQLYEELARIERRSPGCDHAQDLEGAITLLLDGRTSSTAARHRRHDAVRRARFLRQQADRKRAAAALRNAAPLLGIAAIVPSDVSLVEPTPVEPVTTVTPENIVCARETIGELGRPGRGAAGLAAPVLAGLLADQTPAAISGNLKVSRSTVDRCIAHLRTTTRGLLDEATAV